MIEKQAALTPSEAKAYYDRFGRKQDYQEFYEGPPLDDLVSHASFRDAQRVFGVQMGSSLEK